MKNAQRGKDHGSLGAFFFFSITLPMVLKGVFKQARDLESVGYWDAYQIICHMWFFEHHAGQSLHAIGKGWGWCTKHHSRQDGGAVSEMIGHLQAFGITAVDQGVPCDVVMECWCKKGGRDWQRTRLLFGYYCS